MAGSSSSCCSRWSAASPGSWRAGRSGRATAGFPEYERPRPVAPDDDPAFLAGIGESNAEHEKLLRAWEDQLRERERRLAERDDDDRGTPPPAADH